MENGGNQKVNAIFEARLSVAKPTNAASGPVRERFIRDKYERRKFYDPDAFERVSQMESEREQEEVVSGVQRRLAASSQSRKPSDAARRRVEERASRGGASARGGTRAVKAPSTKSAPAPAPVADLLDFGDFDSPEATFAVQAPGDSVTSPPQQVAKPVTTVAATATTNAESDFSTDLFANMTIENGGDGAGVTNGHAQQPPGQPKQTKMSNDDIMSMFNSPAAHHNPMQQNMFAMNGGMPNGMASGMSGGMPNGTASGMAMGATMNNVNNVQMRMMNNNNMQMMQMQMQGSMPQMNNMMMGGGGGMNTMPQQYGQMPQMNSNMMMMGQMQPQMQQGGGGMMSGGNQFGQSPMGASPVGGQSQQRGHPSPQNQQQKFADFGNFGR